MPVVKKEHFEPINDLGDMLRVRFIREGGQVMSFTVQYEALIENSYIPIVRYDAAHGFAHRDELDWHGQTIRKSAMSSDLRYNEAMTEAIDDLAAHWERYRTDFLRRRRRP